MTRASITHAFADGATVTASVESSNDYPDAAVDCVLRVIDLYRQVVPDEAGE
jgi:hypothetical protein